MRRSRRVRALGVVVALAILVAGCSDRDDDGDGRSDAVFDPPHRPVAIGRVEGEVVVVMPACGPDRPLGLVVRTGTGADTSTAWAILRPDDDADAGSIDRVVLGEVPSGYEENQPYVDLPEAGEVEILVQFRDPDDATSTTFVEVRIEDLPTDGELLVQEERETVGRATEEEFQRTLADNGCDEWP